MLNNQKPESITFESIKYLFIHLAAMSKERTKGYEAFRKENFARITKSIAFLKENVDTIIQSDTQLKHMPLWRDLAYFWIHDPIFHRSKDISLIWDIAVKIVDIHGHKIQLRKLTDESASLVNFFYQSLAVDTKPVVYDEKSYKFLCLMNSFAPNAYNFSAKLECCHKSAMLMYRMQLDLDKHLAHHKRLRSILEHFDADAFIFDPDKLIHILQLLLLELVYIPTKDHENISLIVKIVSETYTNDAIGIKSDKANFSQELNTLVMAAASLKSLGVDRDSFDTMLATIPVIFWRYVIKKSIDDNEHFIEHLNDALSFLEEACSESELFHLIMGVIVSDLAGDSRVIDFITINRHRHILTSLSILSHVTSIENNAAMVDRLQGIVSHTLSCRLLHTEYEHDIKGLLNFLFFARMRSLKDNLPMMADYYTQVLVWYFDTSKISDSSDQVLSWLVALKYLIRIRIDMGCEILDQTASSLIDDILDKFYGHLVDKIKMQVESMNQDDYAQWGSVIIDLNQIFYIDQSELTIQWHNKFPTFNTAYASMSKAYMQNFINDPNDLNASQILSVFNCVTAFDKKVEGFDTQIQELAAACFIHASYKLMKVVLANQVMLDDKIKELISYEAFTESDKQKLKMIGPSNEMMSALNHANQLQVKYQADPYIKDALFQIADYWSNSQQALVRNISDVLKTPNDKIFHNKFVKERLKLLKYFISQFYVFSRDVRIHEIPVFFFYVETVIHRKQITDQDVFNNTLIQNMIQSYQVYHKKLENMSCQSDDNGNLMMIFITVYNQIKTKIDDSADFGEIMSPILTDYTDMAKFLSHRLFNFIQSDLTFASFEKIERFMNWLSTISHHPIMELSEDFHETLSEGFNAICQFYEANKNNLSEHFKNGLFNHINQLVIVLYILDKYPIGNNKQWVIDYFTFISKNIRFVHCRIDDLSVLIKLSHRLITNGQYPSYKDVLIDTVHGVFSDSSTLSVLLDFHESGFVSFKEFISIMQMVREIEQLDDLGLTTSSVEYLIPAYHDMVLLSVIQFLSYYSIADRLNLEKICSFMQAIKDTVRYGPLELVEIMVELVKMTKPIFMQRFEQILKEKHEIVNQIQSMMAFKKPLEEAGEFTWLKGSVPKVNIIHMKDAFGALGSMNMSLLDNTHRAKIFIMLNKFQGNEIFKKQIAELILNTVNIQDAILINEIKPAVIQNKDDEETNGVFKLYTDAVSFCMQSRSLLQFGDVFEAITRNQLDFDKPFLTRANWNILFSLSICVFKNGEYVMTYDESMQSCLDSLEPLTDIGQTASRLSVLSKHVSLDDYTMPFESEPYLGRLVWIIFGLREEGESISSVFKEFFALSPHIEKSVKLTQILDAYPKMTNTMWAFLFMLFTHGKLIVTKKDRQRASKGFPFIQIFEKGSQDYGKYPEIKDLLYQSLTDMPCDVLGTAIVDHYRSYLSGLSPWQQLNVIAELMPNKKSQFHNGMLKVFMKYGQGFCYAHHLDQLQLDIVSLKQSKMEITIAKGKNQTITFESEEDCLTQLIQIIDQHALRLLWSNEFDTWLEAYIDKRPIDQCRFGFGSVRDFANQFHREFVTDRDKVIRAVQWLSSHASDVWEAIYHGCQSQENQIQIFRSLNDNLREFAYTSFKNLLTQKLSERSLSQLYHYDEGGMLLVPKYGSEVISLNGVFLENAIDASLSELISQESEKMYSHYPLLRYHAQQGVELTEIQELDGLLPEGRLSWTETQGFRYVLDGHCVDLAQAWIPFKQQCEMLVNKGASYFNRFRKIEDRWQSHLGRLYPVKDFTAWIEWMTDLSNDGDIYLVGAYALMDQFQSALTGTTVMKFASTVPKEKFIEHGNNASIKYDTECYYLDRHYQSHNKLVINHHEVKHHLDFCFLNADPDIEQNTFDILPSMWRKDMINHKDYVPEISQDSLHKQMHDYLSMVQNKGEKHIKKHEKWLIRAMKYFYRTQGSLDACSDVYETYMAFDTLRTYKLTVCSGLLDSGVPLSQSIWDVTCDHIKRRCTDLNIDTDTIPASTEDMMLQLVAAVPTNGKSAIDYLESKEIFPIDDNFTASYFHFKNINT